MSLLRFFKPKDGLPDLTGALSTSVSSAAIAQANREVQNPISMTSRSVDRIRSTVLVFVPKSASTLLRTRRLFGGHARSPIPLLLARVRYIRVKKCTRKFHDTKFPDLQ